MEENKELKQAVEKVDGLSEDERMQRIADLRQKAIWDEKAAWAGGLHEGIKQGEVLGKKAGKKEEQVKIAKKMLELGLEIQIICESTGLTKEVVEKIKNDKTLSK